MPDALDLLLPPLLARQFRVWRRGGTPVACAAWALLDAAAERRLLAGEFRLAPAEWRGGDRLWLIYLVAPYGGLGRFVRDLRERMFPGRALRTVRAGPGGTPVAVRWPPARPKRGAATGPTTRPVG